MIKTVIPERHQEKLKISYSKNGGRLGKCLICSERVRTGQNYLTTSEGYAHCACLENWRSEV